MISPIQLFRALGASLFLLTFFVFGITFLNNLGSDRFEEDGLTILFISIMFGIGTVSWGLKSETDVGKLPNGIWRLNLAKLPTIELVIWGAIGTVIFLVLPLSWHGIFAVVILGLSVYKLTKSPNTVVSTETLHQRYSSGKLPTKATNTPTSTSIQKSSLPVAIRRSDLNTLSDGNYVYVIREQLHGKYKIGKTRSPHKRLSTFGVQLPYEVRPIFIIPCQDMSSLEMTLHRKFASNRLNGEWFDLDDDDLEEIKLTYKVIEIE